MLIYFFFPRADLEQLNDHFQLLSSLPGATRSSLLQQLTEVMQHRAAVSTLQNAVSRTQRSQQHRCTKIMWDFCCTGFLNVGVFLLSQLDQICLDKSPAPGDVSMTESQKQNIQAILDLVQQSGQVESAQTGQTTSVLTALHLISSALDGKKSKTLLITEVKCYFKLPLHAGCPENLISLSSVFTLYLGLCLSEMTNDCLAVLGTCCSHTVLQAMELLVSKTSFYKMNTAEHVMKFFSP